jgi:hypothetical protein
MGQTVIAIAEAAMAVFTLLILGANVVSIHKFNKSLELTRESLHDAKRSTDNQWKIAQGQMLFQANRDFFYQNPHKLIIRKLEAGLSLRAGVPSVEDCDIEDHVGFLDSIGTFVHSGILEPNLVWELFSHYVESAHDSKEISAYLAEIRTEEPGYYSDFEWLYAEMQMLSEAKNRKK